MQADTDRILCVGNTDAQMSKVHSYYDSFACGELLSIGLFHDCRVALFWWVKD